LSAERRSRFAAAPVSAIAAVAALALVSVASGCRQDMHNKGRLKPFEESRFFADGRGARPLPAGTVARGFLRDDVGLYKGQTPEGDFLAKNPLPLTQQSLERGQSRFNIYCTPCHGRVGEGDGMIVARGYKKPTSFHDARLRDVPDGYLFDVMTNGFGQMPAYAAQVTPEDRWAIVGYVRALQLSQNVPAAELTADDRNALDHPSPAPGAETAPAHGGH
jgi:mono/diheme cytochrome c family protein